jgi:hypothetical protein
LFKNKIIYIFYIFGYKKFPPSSFDAVVGYGMDKNQDPGSGMFIPDPQHWNIRKLFALYALKNHYRI